MEKAHGSRPGRIDVGRYYDEFIVPNERGQRAAASQNAAASDESALNTDCISSELSLSQMTRPTRGNTDSGGREAIEEEKVQDPQPDSNGPRSVYEAATERWKGTNLKVVLDDAIKEHGPDPDGCWWVDAETEGTSGQIKERLEFIAAGFENF